MHVLVMAGISMEKHDHTIFLLQETNIVGASVSVNKCFINIWVWMQDNSKGSFMKQALTLP